MATINAVKRSPTGKKRDMAIYIPCPLHPPYVELQVCRKCGLHGGFGFGLIVECGHPKAVGIVRSSS